MINLVLAAIVTVITLLACAGCAASPSAQGSGDVQVTIKAARVKQCKAQGGCQLVTFEELMKMMSDAFDMGKGGV